MIGEDTVRTLRIISALIKGERVMVSFPRGERDYLPVVDAEIGPTWGSAL